MRWSGRGWLIIRSGRRSGSHGMMLPEDKRSAAKVEPVIRQIVDRALKDYREDAEALGEGRMQVPERNL